jgi:hypothetical protein
LDDRRWELEIAINVVSTKHWKHVKLFLGVTNTHLWGFYSSGMWRCVACNVTHADVSKEPSAFLFNGLKAVTFYHLDGQKTTEDMNRYEHRSQKFSYRLFVCRLLWSQTFSVNITKADAVCGYGSTHSQPWH